MPSRTILLTGVTRGCGRALFQRFHEAGHRVIGCGRSESLIAELQHSYPQTHRFDAVDVTDDGAVAGWATSALAQFGPPDLVVNNAGVINRTAPLWEISAEEFRQVLDVNLVGVANVIRHFVPAMIDAGRGVIVNFSSGWGRSTSPEVAPYCATKWGVEGLSLALADELPEGLASIPLNPGIINTEMLRSCWADGALGFPDPETWSKTAAPFLLKLSAKDNGRQMSVGS